MAPLTSIFVCGIRLLGYSSLNFGSYPLDCYISEVNRKSQSNKAAPDTTGVQSTSRPTPRGIASCNSDHSVEEIIFKKEQFLVDDIR
jgi:hypothetical protein